MGFCIRKKSPVTIRLKEDENSAVQIAAGNLQNDLARVFQADVVLKSEMPECKVPDGMCGEKGRKSDDFGAAIHIRTADGTAPVLETLLPVQEGASRQYAREGYALHVENGELYIIGADRRGTVYGIYDVCARIGVSPWRFFADVPDQEKESIELPEGFLFTDYPSVEYRGVFINDEEELEKWVKLHMGEETIGIKTYEKIFELLLRLKGNYIWPAMHVNSFNMKRENGELADRMGIVVGTSHCDMLMRSNNREWYPWLEKKGYRDKGVEYDYSIPGENREILDEYWQESVEQNKDFEVSYTLGMRGIHDSGFETKSLRGLSGQELLNAKINLLETVIGAQERILKEVLGERTGKGVLKTFVPYKEVLELYDNGLKVPEDLTLIWTNDNYGHIRRFPGESEKKRRGGNGIYFHNSYWAAPGMSYLFTKSIPVSQTKNELEKAWKEGIRKLWVLNIGALKPLEIEISFYLRLAWEIGKDKEYAADKGYLTQDVKKCLAAFFEGLFGEWSGGRSAYAVSGAEIAELYLRWAQLTNVRKVELLDSDAFSQNAYGNEASDRMLELQRLKEKADVILEKLPDAKKNAFFQIVLWRIHASYLSNAMYYYADRSAYCNKNGMCRAAELYADRSIHYDRMRRKLLYYYNHVQAEGKWSGIVTPEDYPPPRTAMYPAYVFPLQISDPRLIVKAFGDEESLTLTGQNTKWITIFNGGRGTIRCRIKAPEYVEVSIAESAEGESLKKALSETDIVMVGAERRILIGMKDSARLLNALPGGADQFKDEIIVTCEETGEDVRVSLNVQPGLDAQIRQGLACEEDGIICSEAENGICDILELEHMEQTKLRYPETEGGQTEQFFGEQSETQPGWKRVPYLGRGYGDLMESTGAGEALSYRFFLVTKGEHLLELHRFPSLNSVGEIQIRVKVDGGEPMLLKTDANDEKRGNWKNNVRDDADRMYLRLPALEAGAHTLTFISDSPYFAFSRWAIYTKPRKDNMMGMRSVQTALFGEAYEAEHFFYEDCPLMKRPVIYAPFAADGNSLSQEDQCCEEPNEALVSEDEKTGSAAEAIREILESGRNIFTEREGCVMIEAAAALAQTKYAYTKNADWDYCGGSSQNGRGLAMHIRKTEQTFSDADGKKIPELEYQAELSGGEYTIWILMKYNSYDDAKLKLLLDGKAIPKEQINRNALRKYSAEQVYRYVPLYRTNITDGIHSISVGIYHSDIRIEKICLVKTGSRCF